MWQSFKMGLKIGFNCFLASYTIIIFFFLIGTINFLNMYLKEFSILDLLSFVMCVYNTYWISSVIDIRKSFHKSTLNILANDLKTKKSTKKFIADLIYSIFWRDIYAMNFKDDLEQDHYIEKIVFESIQKYNEGKL